MEEERPLVPEESSEELEEPLRPIRRRPFPQPPPPPTCSVLATISLKVKSVLREYREDITDWIRSSRNKEEASFILEKVNRYLAEPEKPSEPQVLLASDDIKILNLLIIPSCANVQKWQALLLTLYDEILCFFRQSRERHHFVLRDRSRIGIDV